MPKSPPIQSFKAAYGDAWNQDDTARAAEQARYANYGSLSGGPTLDSSLFGLALSLVQRAQENAKPNGKRLPEFSEANRASLDQTLFSPAPI